MKRNKKKTTKEIFEEMNNVCQVDTMLDNSENGFLTKVQGDTVKIVGLAIATKGEGCQQVCWIKSEDFVEPEEEEAEE